MKDKKKLILLIALAILVLGIGAFQFANMSDGEKPQAKAEPKKETPVEPEETTSETDPMTQYAVVYNMAARDPFQEGDLPGGNETSVAPPNPPRMSGSRTGFKIPDALATGGGTFKPVNPNVPGNIGIQHVQAFDVIGAIEGVHPAAVFVDETGRQRLVTVGGTYGDDRQLLQVEGDRVTVRHGGKTITYTVGGTPNAK